MKPQATPTSKASGKQPSRDKPGKKKTSKPSASPRASPAAKSGSGANPAASATALEGKATFSDDSFDNLARNFGSQNSPKNQSCSAGSLEFAGAKASPCSGVSAKEPLSTPPTAGGGRSIPASQYIESSDSDEPRCYGQGRPSSPSPMRGRGRNRDRGRSGHPKQPGFEEAGNASANFWHIFRQIREGTKTSNITHLPTGSQKAMASCF